MWIPLKDDFWQTRGRKTSLNVVESLPLKSAETGDRFPRGVLKRPTTFFSAHRSERSWNIVVIYFWVVCVRGRRFNRVLIQSCIPCMLIQCDQHNRSGCSWSTCFTSCIVWSPNESKWKLILSSDQTASLYELIKDMDCSFKPRDCTNVYILFPFALSLIIKKRTKQMI